MNRSERRAVGGKTVQRPTFIEALRYELETTKDPKAIERLTRGLKELGELGSE